MWLEAIIPNEDLVTLLDEFTPLSMGLGGDGRIWLAEPSEMSLVEGAGLRVTCRARLRWPVLGFRVPITVHYVTVLLRPEVVAKADGPALVFGLEIEHADFAAIPDIIDNLITNRINRELAGRRTDLSWSYAKTLSHVFDLPGRLQPMDGLAIVATNAVVKTTACAIALAIEMKASVRRPGDAKAPAPSTRTPALPPRALPPARPPTPRHAGDAWARRGAVLAGVFAAAVAGAFTLGRRTA
jgi:hypothetical protein